MDFIKGYIEASFKDLGSILKTVGVIALVVALSTASYFGYQSHVATREQAAHKDLVECLKYFQAPILASDEEKEKTDTISFASSEEKWNKVATLCKEMYTKNSSSGLAGIFLAYEAESLLNLNRHEEARPLLKKAVGLIKSGALKNYYAVKNALLDIDSTEQIAQNEGLNTLQRIASDGNNPAADLALFHLGNIYYAKQDFAQVRNYWNQLTTKYGENSANPSPLVHNIEPRLKLLEAEG